MNSGTGWKSVGSTTLRRDCLDDRPIAFVRALWRATDTPVQALLRNTRDGGALFIARVRTYVWKRTRRRRIAARVYSRLTRRRRTRARNTPDEIGDTTDRERNLYDDRPIYRFRTNVFEKHE